jgi:iron complex outermembrane recepter protein
MRNIGDETYIAYAYDFGAVHLGNPRTLGFTLGIKL